MSRSVLGLECVISKRSDSSVDIATQADEPLYICAPLAKLDPLSHSFVRAKVPPGSGQHLVTRPSRRTRSRNNSAAPIDRCVPRHPPARLPPLEKQNSIQMMTTLTTSANNTVADVDEGASCPSEYFKRLREKLLSNGVDVGTNTSNGSPSTGYPEIKTRSKQPAKLCPISSKAKAAALLSKKNHMKRRTKSKNQSNSSGTSEPVVTKRKGSMMNMKTAAGDFSSPAPVPLVKEDTLSSTSTTAKVADSVSAHPTETNTTDPVRQSAKLRITEDLDEFSVRDRYLSAMEELLKKHKGLSPRTTRGPAALGANSGPAVPSRRIQPLTNVPEDPMMRFTGRHIYHSMGFKVQEKSDSLWVEPDHDQIHQVSLLQECEQRLIQSTTLKGSQQTYQTPMHTEVATSLPTALQEQTAACMLQGHDSGKTDSRVASYDQSSLEPISSDSEPSLSNTGDGEPQSQSERSTHQPTIDSNRIYFHFNPVVQVYPNQTAWRCRSNLSSKRGDARLIAADSAEAHRRPDDELVNDDDSGGDDDDDDDGEDDEIAEHCPGPDVLDDTQQPTRRAHSVDPVLMRCYSMDKVFEMRQVIRSMRQAQTSSSSSMSNLEIVKEITELHESDGRLRRVRSASEGAVGLGTVLGSFTSRARVTSLTADSTAVIGLNSGLNERSAIPHGGSSHPRTSLLIPDRPVPSSSLCTDVVKPGTEVTLNTADFKTPLPVHKQENAGRFSMKQNKTIPAQCMDLLMASIDPNPMTWFDVLDERMANSTQRVTFREKLIAQFRLKGLQKRFVAIPHGLYGLQRELEKGWEVRPKPELLMSCLVKHHVLKMPMNIGHPELVEKIYENSIVRYPVLYKLIMRRREILPQELQQFLNRIMELTETSDRMMASITNCTSKLSTVVTAAKEMDASGFMTGGPRMKTGVRESRLSACSRQRSQGLSQVSRAGLPMQCDKETLFTERSDSLSKPNNTTTTSSTGKKDVGLFPLYGKETDFDKGFYTVLRNPCTNILEEVALHIPEFAWHVRPLFEHCWATLEDDLFEKMLEQGAVPVEHGTEADATTIQPSTVDEINYEPHPSTESAADSTLRGFLLRWPETYDFCEQLLSRVINRFAGMEVLKPGTGMLKDLLICIHMTTYSRKLGDTLVKELDQWVPTLLSGLESNYSSVREDTCCVLAYLVCSYRLMTRLHGVSKNLLVANISFAVLSAIGHYPESYAFYHGLLGYMLHALPCLSTLDCLLLWLPSVQNSETNLVARDWSLFVYYVLRHWPRNPFYLDPMYQKKLLKPLEMSFLTKHAKRAARLALSYLVRTCNVRSALLVCWPESEDDVPLV